MTITTTTLTRAAGLSAVAAGLLFIAVQIGHPNVDLALVTTTEWKVRQTVKVVMAALSLVGITGMYLRQVKQTGVLGLLGYLTFAVGYLIMLSIEVIGLVVIPSIARSSPGYVSDVLVAATGGHPAGDIGLMQTVQHRQPASPSSAAACSSASHCSAPTSWPGGPPYFSPPAPSQPSRSPCCRRSTSGCSPFPPASP